jgi:hypothetical protein
MAWRSARGLIPGGVISLIARVYGADLSNPGFRPAIGRRLVSWSDLHRSAGVVVVLEVGDVEFRLTLHKRVGVLQVVGHGQQIRVSPQAVPALDAPDLSQALPDRGRFTQPARAQFQADQGGERALRRATGGA